jgi:REP-associated tyrosine transposase
MRAPFTQLYVHCVWSTWDRLPLISSQIERQLYAALLKKCHEMKCEPIAIGGMPDHIHLLVRLYPTVAIADLIKEVKGSTSHLMTHKICPGEFFKWQGAYGAFTLSKDAVPKIKIYIERQKDHHGQDDLWMDCEQTEVGEYGD